MSSARLIGFAILAGSIFAACAGANSQPAPQNGTNVAVGAFDNVELRGGGHVTLHYGTAQHVELVAGSTQYTSFHVEDGHKLVIDACNETCPNRYDLQIEITVPVIKGVAIDGGGHIESAPGFPTENKIGAAVNGGGHIDLSNIDTKSCAAAIQGGGHIQVRVESDLEAAVNGGGTIRYLGNPRVASAVNGGGSIQREGGSD